MNKVVELQVCYERGGRRRPKEENNREGEGRQMARLLEREIHLHTYYSPAQILPIYVTCVSLADSSIYDDTKYVNIAKGTRYTCITQYQDRSSVAIIEHQDILEEKPLNLGGIPSATFTTYQKGKLSNVIMWKCDCNAE